MQLEKDKIKAGENENLEPDMSNETLDVENVNGGDELDNVVPELRYNGGANAEPGVNENTDTGDTLTPNDADGVENATPQQSEDISEENVEPQEKMLTQSQVNELVGRARQEGRESALKELMARYGVSNDSEMDDIFGKGQAYEDLNYDFENQGMSYKSALAENALLKSNIDENRWEDVKLILGGKGLEVNADNIAALLPSHPEWRNSMTVQQASNSGELGETNPTNVLGENELQNMLNQKNMNQMNTPNNPPMRLKKLGNEPSGEQQDNTYDEEKQARKLFGFTD